MLDISGDVRSACKKFDDAKRELDRAHEYLRVTFEREVHSTTKRIESIARQPAIFNAIQCAAPSLAEMLVRHEAPSDRSSRRGIRHDRLARFVYRAAAKTSPYSTFTLTGKVTKTGGVNPDYIANSDIELVRQIDGRLLSAVVADIVRNWSESRRAKWRVNPSLTKRSPSEHGYLVLAEPPAESIRSLPALPLLDYLYGRRYQAPVIFEELEKDTSDALGIPMKQVRMALASARSAGILQCETPISAITSDPLGAILTWASDISDTDAPPYSEHLESLRDYVIRRDNLTNDNRLERAALRQRAITDAEKVADTLDSRDIDVYVHESSQISPAVACTRPSAHALRTIAAAYAWLSLLDIKLPARLMLGQYISKKYGTARIPLLDLYLDYELLNRNADRKNVADYAYWFDRSMRQPEGFRDTSQVPEVIRRLGELRDRQRSLVDAMNLVDGTIQIPLNVIEDAIRATPDELMCRQGGTAYLQQTDQGSAEWVVNVFHGGNGRGYARMDYLRAAAVGGEESLDVARSDETKHAIAQRRDQKAALLAEYSGIHGSSLNLRTPVLDAVIDYPYTAAGDGSTRRRIPIADIAVEIDHGDQLAHMVVANTGERVTPVHVGMMADHQLSPLATFMERYFGETYLMHPSSPPFASSFELASLRGITEIPRIQVGDIIVRRHRWIVQENSLPSIDAHTSDLNRWLALRNWFAQHGLPPRCYLRIWPGLTGANAPAEAKSRKPTYFDIDSWWSVAPLARRELRGGFIVMDEALPDVGRFKDRTRCSELLVEFESWFGSYAGGYR